MTISDQPSATRTPTAATHVPIRDLPTALTTDDAVAVAYRDDLDWIEERLRGRLSVLVECDKQLSLYLFKQLRNRLKRNAESDPLGFVIVDGRPRKGTPSPHIPSGAAGESDADATAVHEQPRGVLQTTVANLQQHLLAYDASKILCVPHLDLITTVTRSGLTVEAREVAALLYENPGVVLLAFQDPSFELPKVVESLFPYRRQVMGVPRHRLPQLVLAQEARKFAVETFNPYRLYTFTSGLNVVRFRQVMQHFLRERDFDPYVPNMERQRRNMLRGLTATGEFELPDVHLDRDIAGYRGVKKRLRREILDLVDAKDRLDDPQEIEAIEELIPRGIILEGPAGTGKTLFAKALATELNATVIVVSGPEIKSKWLGETEANLRRLFAQARRAAPSVIVFDEIDSIAPSRGRQLVHEASHSTVNQLLTEMDGFRPDELVFVVGTTNFAASLDPALLRPGRFELKILVDNPHDLDRDAILRLYRERLRMNLSDEQIDALVRKTRGWADRGAGHRFTGDHIYSIMKALKRDMLRTNPGQPDAAVPDAAIRRVMRTFRGEDVTPNEDELRVIAVHEAGHAVLQEVLPDHPPTEKVTLDGDDADADISRFFTKPEDPINAFVQTDAEIRALICALYGGRIAEQLTFGTVSGGAALDFEMATRAARAMVLVHGMSPPRDADAIPALAGPLAGHGYSVPTLLRSFWSQLDNRDAFPISPDLLERVDRSVEQILEEEYARAMRLLHEHRTVLDEIAARLLANRELTRDAIRDILPAGANEKAETWTARRERLASARRKADADDTD